MAFGVVHRRYGGNGITLLHRIKSSHRLGLLMAAGGFLFISLDSLGLRLADTGSWDATFWLGVFTFSAMLILIPLKTGESLFRRAKAGGIALAVSALFTAGSISLFVVAIELTTVANTVAIIAAAPVMAALISLVAIGERTRLRTWIGILASIAGILIIVSGSLGAGRIAGDLAAVGAIIVFGSNLTLLRRFPDLNRLAIIGMGGLAMALIAVLPAEPLTVEPSSLVVLAILGMLTSPAGRVAVISSTRYLPPAQVSLFAPIETIAATTWAWLFLSETPPPLTIVGGLIVVVAVVYGTTGQPPESTADLATAP